MSKRLPRIVAAEHFADGLFVTIEGCDGERRKTSVPQSFVPFLRPSVWRKVQQLLKGGSG